MAGYTESAAEGHPPWYGSWAPPGAARPIVDRHTLMVLYTPQIEEAKDFFRQLRWILQQKHVANQDVVLIEHTSVWLVEPSPLVGSPWSPLFWFSPILAGRPIIPLRRQISRYNQRRRMFLPMSSRYEGNGFMSTIPAKKTPVSPPAHALEDRLEDDRELATRFRALAAEWKTGRGHSSSITKMANHPAYRKIAAMGRPAIPLILGELEREPDHWFWALKAITGCDPVPPSHRGNIDWMAADWLAWGRSRGYVQP